MRNKRKVMRTCSGICAVLGGFSFLFAQADGPGWAIAGILFAMGSIWFLMEGEVW